VYPLKFVFTFLFGIFARQGLEVRLANGTTTTMIQSAGEVTTLMIIFSLGYVAVFGLFVLMYAHAYKNRKKLELNELEVFDTRTDIRESALNVGIGSISVAFAVLARNATLSGMSYMLCPIVMTAHGMVRGKRRRRIEERLGFHESTMFEPTT
jgi:hypothetical protein